MLTFQPINKSRIVAGSRCASSALSNRLRSLIVGHFAADANAAPGELQGKALELAQAVPSLRRVMTTAIDMVTDPVARCRAWVET